MGNRAYFSGERRRENGELIYCDVGGCSYRRKDIVYVGIHRKRIE